MSFSHISVMPKEVIEYLQIKPDGIYLDGTLGGAGHASRVLEQLSKGLLIGIDKDEDALHYSKKKLSALSGNFVLAKADFYNADLLLDELEVDKIQGAILDLGVSSYQLDQAQRGFSYHQDAPLDMRMNQCQKIDAAYIVNEYSEEELSKILWEYGEERWAKRIASFIVDYRPIETTLELVDVIKRAIPAAARESKHPGRKTFQALRIAVNGELDTLDESLNKIFSRIDKGGRLVVITFHSLEDRIVKKTFAAMQKGCICPPELPVCLCGQEPSGKIITRKPIQASFKELEFNPRSRSAKLRVIERI
ncbi:MAG TPA: 16S rRNA (cytosine(1402)-N(4))-methyltransferase RsmH [Clostridia bacterium]|nr:16S rRNA (cytosine(1402)-N(4))-methyltransferase RsmH [Clostridia bacterium]